jgi:hypothetical protein
MKRSIYLSALAMMLLLAACTKEEVAEVPSSDKTIEFLVNGNPSGGNYTLFSFEKGGAVPSADSNSLKWDFGLRFETFIINSKASGPGNAFVQILNQPYSAVTSAALSGYKFDTTASQKAIKGLEWYTYNAIARQFSPIAGKTFVFVTANGKYAKMEVLKADPADNNGNPVTPPTRPTRIKYTLRYFYQKNGSPNFQ